MATELHPGTPEHASLTELVTGIVNDAQELLRQQLALFRSEIKEDLRKSREMASSLVVGAVLGLVAGIMVAFMLAELIHLAIPQLWVCYAIVGGLLAITAGVLIYMALKTLQNLDPLGKTTEAIQENLEWKTSRRTQR